MKDYGTFFISNVEMGAKLWIESRYSSKSESRTDIAKRMGCIQSSLSKGSSSGFETPEIEYEVAAGAKGAQASAKYKMQHIKIGSSSGSNSQRNK